ncbi:NAD(P)-dependent oxidoreductase [Geodermatophilus sp. YIM 151500]|uniref:NAD(P)-dependent oxidoreductase n=1 Tax=Geodermatophilus sp. YIM 151500 TaxID=2984531 RepID=UPI0021E4B134|nr:NAD(P)-dependent oxidoreductase [Geodermatophilus sp. YIM 151500]MCV2488845.1 NAD(P)-dependent oxidoreductase [Geodermatophilus sp. YIM 151500]
MTPDPVVTPEPVGFVGLGVMGSAMSGHLLAAGFPVLGFDVDAGRRAQHEARGGSVCASPAEVAAATDVVVTSLPSAAALLAVVDGEQGLAAGARPGLVVVETSTLSPETKEEGRRRAAAFGATLLDCPMSGTGQQARDGDLIAYLSGDPEAKERALPVLVAFTRAQHDLGAFGQGTTMKLVANLLVAVHNVAAAEALLLAQRAGLDLDTVLAAVGDGAGGSRMLQVRGPLMAAGRFDEPTATVATMLKDNALIAGFAASVASPTPLFAASAVLYHAAVAQGRLGEDTACVYGVLQRLAGQ